MKHVKIKGGQSLKGSLIIPPSKSLSHRGIIAASLAEGQSVIGNLIQSKDIIATTQCMRQLGAEIEVADDYIVKGVGRKMNLTEATFDCHESGSTLRFLIPIAAMTGEAVTFTGQGKLVERPLDPFYNIFDEQGIPYEHDGKLPLTVKGSIKAGTFTLPGDISSQFITGLLFVLPLLEGDSEIIITSPLESKGYIDLTLDVLDQFGIKISHDDHQKFVIKGQQKYIEKDYRVEGDYSQVAFWIVAGLINGDLKCLDMNPNSSQGDRLVVDIVKNMMGQVTYEDNSIRVQKTDTKATVIDASQCPDIIPVLAVLASVSEGETHIINAKRLRIKECDRLEATRTELNKLGADVTELEEGLIIKGKPSLKGGQVSGWNDHRIVMAMAVASLVCEGDVFIEGAQAITKSYPHFFEQFEALGGQVDEWHMEK